jgi:hypothetical protein
MRKKKGLKRIVKGTCFGWSNINKKSSSAKGFNPKARRKRILNKEGTKNIINRAKRSFGLPILRRSISIRTTKKYAVKEKEVVV